jgi:hypothetical protein
MEVSHYRISYRFSKGTVVPELTKFMQKRKRRVQDIAGQRYGSLLVLEYLGGKGGNWKCQCDCGAECTPRNDNILRGRSTSCGCKRQLGILRGPCKRAYNTWTAMRSRCNNPNDDRFARYGGRGIKVCERWAENFDEFLADVGIPPKGTTLGRIDNDGNYEPGNVRWETMKQQCRNTRRNRLVEYQGQTKCIAEWAEIAGMSQSTLAARICIMGWPVERAMTEPVHAIRSGPLKNTH